MSQLYAIQGTETGKVKLGITDNFDQRLPSYRTHCAEPIEVLMVIDIGGARSAAERVEAELLKKWAKQKSHGEWLFPTENMLQAIRSLPRIYTGWGDGIQWVSEDHKVRKAMTPTIYTTQGGVSDLLIGEVILGRFSHPAIAFVVMCSIGRALREEYVLEADGSGVKSALPEGVPGGGEYDNTVPDESGAWAI